MKLNNDELFAAIKKIRRLYTRWSASRKKGDLYRYLGEVFDAYAAWKSRGVDYLVGPRLIKLLALTPRRKAHPCRIMIEATSGTDRKTRSRWVRALRFGWHSRKKHTSFRDCLRKNGGVAGCATAWADLQFKHPGPEYVRLGGEDRVPKIPFFVHVSMFDEQGNIIWRPLAKDALSG